MTSLGFALAMSRKKVCELDREPWTADSLAASASFVELVGFIRTAGNHWRSIRATASMEAQGLEDSIRLAIDLVGTRLEALQPPKNAWRH